MRTKTQIKYHGRKGYPVIHKSTTNKKYIMVRATGGGVKRLYSGSKYQENGRQRRLKL